MELAEMMEKQKIKDQIAEYEKQIAWINAPK